MPDVTLSSPLALELLAGHVLMMQCGASARRTLDQARPGGTTQFDLRAGDEAMRMGGLSARLMQHHTAGVQLLRRLPPAALASSPAPAIQPASSAKAEAPSTIRKLHANPGASRGRLKNGNPSGDYLKSPRCGAHTRAGGCCRQPAMANGRCRMHGGLSTGPRTPEGLARCRTTRLVHGYRTRAHIALRSRAAHAARRRRDLTAELRASFAGHGVHRSEIRSQKTEARTQRPSATDRLHPDVRSLASASPAGHGVHRSDSLSRNDTVMQSHLENPFASPRLCGEPSPTDRTVPAGHGLHRSVRDHLRSSVSICGFKSFPPAPAAPMRNFVLSSAASYPPAPGDTAGALR